MEEDDRESNALSENDRDEVMEDADDAENDRDPEEEEADEEEEMEADPEAGQGLEGEADREADPGAGPRTEVQAKQTDERGPRQNREVNGAGTGKTAASEGTAIDSAETMAATGPMAQRAASTTPVNGRLRPQVRPEAVTARLYDIVPTMAAPQATSINALAVTPDLRYWMTGGADGYIRKYDGPGTINGKQLLTVAQRHPFVDSVVKAGILMSYWENDEPPAAGGGSGGGGSGSGAGTGTTGRTTTTAAEDHILSPVYSLAVHSRALWLLSGTEGGGINLQSVRHDEGKRITSLLGHANAVSVLQLAPDERSVLSGSWDKNIFDWDLNNGQVRRRFDGSGGQISTIELRPASGAPIPTQGADEPTATLFGDSTFSSSNSRSLANGIDASGGGGSGDTGSGAGSGAAPPTINGDDPIPDHESLFGSPGGPLFEDSLGGNPFGDDDLGTTVDGFSQDVDMVLDSGEGASGTFVPTFVDANADAADASGEGSTSLTKNPADELVSPGLQQNSSERAQPTSSVATVEAAADPADPSESAADTQVESDALQTSQGIQSLPKHESPPPSKPSLVYTSQPSPAEFDPTQVSDSTFFSASIDGTIRIWDRRQALPIARIGNRPGVPPWCMGACWSPDGNRIYAGRRNGIVEEFDIHHARSAWQPERALRFPAGSGPISAVRAMVNGRHLVCASHDILRLYDLHDTSAFRNSSVPFLIIPGPPRAGVISHLYIDQTSRYMISTAGTRGWEGTNTEALIGYEINAIRA